MAGSSHSTSLDQLTNLYKYVIDDVVRNMKEEYLNQSMDTDLLEELRQIWLSKLSLSGAVDRPAKPDPPPPKLPKELQAKSSHKSSSSHGPSGLLQMASLPSTSSSSSSSPLQSRPPPPLLTPTISAQDSVIHHAPPRTTPISSRITSSPAPPPLLLNQGALAATMATQRSSSGATPIIVPSSVGQIPPLTSGAMTTTGGGGGGSLAGITPAVNPFSAMNLNMMNPTVGQMGQLANSMVPIQTHQGTMLVPFQTFMALNQLKQQQQQQQATPTSGDKNKEVVQLDGFPPLVGVVPLPHGVEVMLVQLDGLTGGGGGGGGGGGAREESSSEDSDMDDDSSEEEAGPESKVCSSPLNSADDLTDDEDDDHGTGEPGEGKHFETQDTIVCQWEKVYRVKNKWKFLLKDGVMHIAGYDYIFHKIAGEADW